MGLPRLYTQEKQDRPRSARRRHGLPVRLLAAALLALPTQALLQATPAAHAASDWYVAISGTDSASCGTSSGNPCRHIQYTIDNRAASGDRIKISAGDYNELVKVDKSLTLLGAGAGSTFLDGSTLTGSVVTITTSASISGVTIENGSGTVVSSGFVVGGGIQNLGTLTLSNSAVTNNKIGGGTTMLAVGGGIFSTPTLTVLNSTISNNSASALNLAGGGGIFAIGSLTVDMNSTISNNTVTATNSTSSFLLAEGGGVSALGTTTINNSTVSNNTVTGTGNTTSAIFDIAAGGGIGTIGALTLSKATISDNHVTGTTQGLGGGVFTLDQFIVSANLAVSNSTISGNTAFGQFFSAGGGIDDSYLLLTGTPFLTANAAQANTSVAQLFGVTPQALSDAEAPYAGKLAHLGTLSDLRTQLQSAFSQLPGVPASAFAIHDNPAPALPPVSDTIANSVLSGNTAGSTPSQNIQPAFIAMGGGLINGVVLTVTSSAVSGNLSAGFLFGLAGGIDNTTSPIVATIPGANALTVLGSTIDHNTVFSLFTSVGGGIRNSIFPFTISPFSPLVNIPDGPLTVANSTITANQIATFSGPAFGGGIALSSLNTPPSDSIKFSTINDNSALSGSPIGTAQAGANIDNASDTVTLQADIIALTTTGLGASNCLGVTFVDAGFNLEYQAGTTLTYPTDCGLTTGNHDLLNQNPLLGALANNGGPTIGAPGSTEILETEALSTGSPASPAIGLVTDPTVCQASPINDMDERTLSRFSAVRGVCDAGAYDTGGNAVGAYSIVGAIQFPTLPGHLGFAGLRSTTTLSTDTVQAPLGYITFQDGASSLVVPQPVLLSCPNHCTGTSTVVVSPATLTLQGTARSGGGLFAAGDTVQAIFTIVSTAGTPVTHQVTRVEVKVFAPGVDPATGTPIVDVTEMANAGPGGNLFLGQSKVTFLAR